MTSEEIKLIKSMSDVLQDYGLRPNRAGFIHCPFHQGDNTPSMKIYKDGFHCFGCGAHGDIFDFVRLSEHCDFKTAFKILGGEYKDHSASLKMSAYHKKMARIQQEKEARRQREEWIRTVDRLKAEEKALKTILDMKVYEPLSDEWCIAMNWLISVSGQLDMLCGIT